MCRKLLTVSLVISLGGVNSVRQTEPDLPVQALVTPDELLQ